ncbi:MAG: MFS transporter [Armatimonadota bacterium]|nr:MFS transporter [Armatimonadota bacterium]
MPAPAPAADLRPQIRILFGTVFIAMIGFGIVMPILPFYARAFGASAVEMGLLVTGWAGAQFIAAPVWGVLADRVGRKPVLVAGLAGYGITFVGMALAPTYAALLAARVVGGLLSSSVLPSGQAIAADLTRPEDRGAVMGLMGAAFGLGFVVGPAIGGLAALLGPEVPFYAAAAASGLAVPLVARWVREPAVDARQKRAARLGLGGIPASLRSPQRPLYLMSLAATAGGSSLFSMLGYYAIDRVGADPATVGLLFTAVGLGSVLTQVLLVGPATRRWGEARAIEVGFVGSALGFVGIALAASVPGIVAALGLGAVAQALLRPSLVALNSRTTRLGYGTSLGVQTAFDSLGRTLGPLWAGALYGLDPRAPFVGAAVIYLAGAAGGGRLPGRRPEAAPEAIRGPTSER